MWELPRVTRAEGEEAATALARLGQELGIVWQSSPHARFATLKHGVTRYQIELECWGVEVQSAKLNDDLRWFALEDALKLALPSTMKTLLWQIERANGQMPAQQLALWS